MSESCMHAIALDYGCPYCEGLACRCGHLESEHGQYGPCLAETGPHHRLCTCSRYERAAT